MFKRKFHLTKIKRNTIPTDRISIVVNSCDDQRFRKFELRFLRWLDIPHVKVIRITDAVSMAEGYNRGAERATADWLFFCHDDIGILDKGSGIILLDAMRHSDVFGPCGTQRLVSGNWYDAGEPYNAGSVVAPDPGRPGAYRLELFGKSTKRFVQGIQALDGLFIACRRKVFDTIRGFDDFHFQGFHTYDVDFSFRAYLAGFECVVVNDLLLLHDSNVSKFSEEKLKAWEHDQMQFTQRFRCYLSKNRGIRKHDNIPLDTPEDGTSARKVALRSARWWG